jgi:hypothetical protein
MGDQFRWTPAPAGFLCAGKKDQNEQRIDAVPHLAQFGTNFTLDNNDDDSCTYNERCDGAGTCLMDIADCVFAQSCSVNPAPNDCIADTGLGEGLGQCKDINLDDMCDDNTQVCAYTKAAGGMVCHGEVDACNLQSTCNGSSAKCPETDVAPRVVTTDAAVEIVDHVETPFFSTHFLSWPTSEVKTPASLTTSLATHEVGGGCTANGACTSIPTIKTSSTGVAHACGELSYSLGVSLYTETSTCDYVIPRAEEIAQGAFRYIPAYQSKRVDVRDGAYAWYELAGNVADSTDKKGAYPWDQSYPTVTSVAGTNDGTLVGTLDAVADHLGRDGEALAFDGIDTFIELPHSPLAGGVEDFTVTSFIKPGGPFMGLNPATWSGRHGIVGFHGAPSLVIVGRALEYSVWDSVGRHAKLIPEVFTEVRWYYVVLRKSGATYQIWIDGLTDGKQTTTDGDTTFGPEGQRTTTDMTNQDAYTMVLSSTAYLTTHDPQAQLGCQVWANCEPTQPTQPSTTQYRIGRVDGPDGAHKFEGSISDIAFFNEALSAAQILQFFDWDIQLSNTAKPWYCEDDDGEDLGTFNVGSPTACKQECRTVYSDRTGHICNDIGYDFIGTTLGAVNVNSDIIVADGTMLQAKIRLLDMFDERQWQAQFSESKPEVCHLTRIYHGKYELVLSKVYEIVYI